MLRRCDGKDPNLRRKVEVEPHGWKYIPCDCGAVFDDVDRMTIWPHERV